jgi:hypothetical protein
MMREGLVKAGDLVIDCKPCYVAGTGFTKDDIYVVSEGTVVFKWYDKIAVITVGELGTKVNLLNIIDVRFLVERNENCMVIKL